jgi:ABC-type sugar transport system permease subunit
VLSGNYIELLKDPAFRKALWITLKYSVIDSLGSFLLGLLAALVMNSKVPALGTMRVLVIIPWVIPYVIVGVVWKWILHPMGGIMPEILGFFHLNPDLFSLNYPSTALSGLLIATIWRGFPFVALMLLSALQGIDDQLYESAKIDGASKSKVLMKITLPLIRPVMAICILLRMVWSSNQFDTIFMMTGGGPMAATETSSLYIYRNSFEYFDTGKGSAASFIQLFIFLLLCLPHILHTKKEFEE